MSNTIKNNATSVNNAPHSVTEKGGSTSLKEEQKLTGRLEVRLPPDVEIVLLKLIANNTKTKSQVICRLIKRCRLFFHLTKEEIDVYMTLKDCKDAFVKLKSVLNSFNEKERLKFFHNNPDYMENWIAVVDQCIEQWDRILQKSCLSNMVGKGKEVAHGAVLMNYILTKEKAVFLRSNLLGDERDPDRIWALMQLHQINTRNLRKANHKIKNTAIEFEVSPSLVESLHWLPPDFDRLLDELLDELNRIDLSEKTGRKSSAHFDLRKCQFIAAIHYDSKSGLPHLHLGVNRIDMNGQALDCHKLGGRILRAIHNINVRHGWELPEDIHEEHKKQIDEACMNALKKMRFFNWDVYGRILADSDLDLKVKRDSNGEVVNYVIMMGNSKFKASDLGKSRNLTAKNIEATWRKIHLQMEMERKAEEMKARQNQPKPVLRPAVPNPMRPVIAVPTPAVQTQSARYTAKYEVNGKTIDIDIPQSIYDILKQNCQVPEDNDVATVDDVVKTAVLLFLGYVDAATTVAQSCGGGGSQPESGWGKKEDEDDKERARRCAAMAHNMCKPKQKVKYKFGR